MSVRQAATNLVASFSSEIARPIELYSLSLQAVIDGIGLPEIKAISAQRRQVVLLNRALFGSRTSRRYS